MVLVGWLIVVAAVLTALGWIKDAWFFSVGYAASVAVMLVITAVVARQTLSLASLIQLLVLLAWAVRMFVFLTTRERAASYQGRADADRTPIPYPARVPLWIMCALLYPAMVTPTVLAAQAPTPRRGWLVATVIGLVLLTAGVLIEAVADAQKQRAKRVDPKVFVSTGLFGWVRVPNYLGETLVWTGSLLAGAHALTTPLRIVVALLGWGSLVFIMLGATRRIERTQRERYGHLEEFQRYSTTVPVLLPWIPVYSIRALPVPEL